MLGEMELEPITLQKVGRSSVNDTALNRHRIHGETLL